MEVPPEETFLPPPGAGNALRPRGPCGIVRAEVTMSRRRNERPGEEAPERRGAPREDDGRKQPYYEGYFGTEEEEGVERERQAPDPEEPDPA
jgi:hypothetical protein